MPRGSTCKAKGCTSNKNDNPELSFHSFPRNKERFKLWCESIKRPDLNHGKAISSRMSMRVCSLHFEDHMYMSPTNKSRLIWCAVPKPLEIKVLETGETTPVAHLSEPDASEKSDAYSSCAEDIIIKEECVMDQDSNNDVSLPSCSPHESSPEEYFVDSKVGILDHSYAGLPCVKERVESKSFQDDLGKGQTSCFAKSSSQLESSSPQSPICLPSTPSHPSQSKPSKFESTETMDDTISVKEDFYEKSQVNMKTKYTGKNGCSEDCGCNKCFAAEEIRKKAEVLKATIRRTYSGPIRRQIVKTKTGGRKTIMIVKKASLKNLQAKGLIQPITTKYLANPAHSLQSLKKNTIPHVSDSADDPSNGPLKFSQSEDSLPLKEADSSRKSSSAQMQLGTDENSASESSTEYQDEPYMSSHGTQTSNPQTLNQDTQPPVINHDAQPPVINQNTQSPVTVSWAPVKGSNTLSFTFTVTLPTEVSTPSGISQDSLQKATSMLNNSGQCAVSLPNSQAREPLDPNQISDSHSASNSGISPDQRVKGNKESVSAHSITTSQDSLQIDTPTVSSKHLLPSPVVSTCMPRKKIDTGSDSCSSNTTSPTINAFTAPLTQKDLNSHPFHVTMPDLSGEASSEEENIQCSKSPEKSKQSDQLTKTRPKNTDSVQWIAMPPLHQPQPSSSGAPEPVHKPDFTRKCQLSNTTLHCPKQSSGVHGSSFASIDQRGKRLHFSTYTRSVNKELKLKYAGLLSKHRHRYYMLMRRYKVLEEKYSAVKDAGTTQQVLRDAHRFLSDEHILFFESQMFLKNRPGTGNRFSRKFMKLMMEYYSRSAAGYKFLRTIFTIPSVKTVQKWISKSTEFTDVDEDAHGDSKEESEAGNDEESYPTHMKKPDNICQDSNSYENLSQANVSAQSVEYVDNCVNHCDSGECGLEVMEAQEAEHQY